MSRVEKMPPSSGRPMNTPHLVLLGDSIFDNARYVPGGPPVIEQVREVLKPDWLATLVARDGDVVADLARQISLIPANATHLVVSIGGNDALSSEAVLSAPARSVIEALGHLAEMRRVFRDAYRDHAWSVAAFPPQDGGMHHLRCSPGADPRTADRTCDLQ